MPWLDEWDAARYVNRTQRTLYRWRKAKLVHTVRRKGIIYFDRDELRAARLEAEARVRDRKRVARPIRLREGPCQSECLF